MFGVSKTMSTSRRKLVLSFFVFLGVMTAAATGVLAYSAHEMQLARFGDIFDRIVSEQSQTWVTPALVVIGGFSIIALLLFIGLFFFGGREAGMCDRDSKKDMLRTMNPKTLRLFIIGVALLIFGPALIRALYCFGIFQTAPPPANLPDFGPSPLVTSVIPVVIGIVSGAAGVFIIFYATITHVFGSKRDAQPIGAENERQTGRER